jgi:transposase InsO family protein
LALLGLLGPAAGLPTLLAFCPDMARREIQDMMRRYRRVWKRRHRMLVRMLHWHRIGAVWAADFAEPPLAVDGCYSRLLAVRDLASGFQLAWLPVADESARTTCDALIDLFRSHGAPLVLKSDNGSGFIGELMHRVLADGQVWHLRSPPDLPEYNGACEAGIGSMKTRTHHQAARGGRPGAWTCDDAEAARLQANETARPWGCGGPTPAEVWAHRRPLTNAERTGFEVTCKEMVANEYAVRDIKPKSKMSRSEQAAVDRAAIARALVAVGILSFTSKLVVPSLNG